MDLIIVNDVDLEKCSTKIHPHGGTKIFKNLNRPKFGEKSFKEPI